MALKLWDNNERLRSTVMRPLMRRQTAALEPMKQLLRQRLSVVRLLSITISASTVLISEPPLHAQQAAGPIPVRPSTSVLNVVATNPRKPGTGYPTMLLKVSSTAGVPLRIAAPFGRNTWSVYSSSGAICDGRYLEINGITWLSATTGELGGPPEVTAGVKAAAMIPIMITCQGFNRGDEITINVLFYAAVNGSWVPQHFSFSGLKID